MTDGNDSDEKAALAAANPYSGSSLVPMLISGLVLIIFGMFAAAALS